MLDERRALRLLDESDTDELYAVIEANRAHLARWMPWAQGQTLEGTRDFIRRSLRQLADNQGFQAAMIEDGAIVGELGYHRLDWENLDTSLGYWIAESAQGRGTVTLAVSALVDHAFDHYQLNRLEIRAATENARSRAIPERLGFTLEGVRRQAERLGDHYVDHAVYAMLAGEWARLRDGQPAR
ncbi:MAG TPA: GNAT family protein [Solirubrobacteraceae bacterium]|nr:GNAT family protein [Solirubrobacteraceae bacterium]